MAHEPGLGTARTYQPGEMPLSTRPRPACRDDIKLFTRKRVASLPCLAQFKTAVPPERARVEEEVKTNERMEDLSDTRDELDRVRRILARTQGDRDMWRRLPEGCNKKRGEEIGRNESGTIVTVKKKKAPHRQSQMELLTTRKISRTTKVQVPTVFGRATIPDTSSGMTATYATIDDTSTKELSSEVSLIWGETVHLHNIRSSVLANKDSDKLQRTSSPQCYFSERVSIQIIIHWQRYTEEFNVTRQHFIWHFFSGRYTTLYHVEPKGVLQHGH